MLICLGLLQTAAAQSIDIRLDTRYSLNYVKDGGYGFHGDYFNLRIDGTLGENLRYTFLQRLNKPIYSRDIFNATDCAYLLYRRGSWGVQAGKMQLEYGGFEYDEAPINVYFGSEYYYYYNGGFQFGISGLYYFGESSSLRIQLSQSPYSEQYNDGLFSYSLCARGSEGFYAWKHSINLFDLPGGGHQGNIVLGNCFTFGPARLELDLLQRGGMQSFKFFDDCSAVANLVVSPKEWMNVMAKISYDRNFTQTDPLIPVHGEYWSYGGGFEFFPRKGSRDIRLHALYYHFHAPSACLGLTWRIHLLQR